AQLVAEAVDDLIRLVVAQQPVVNEDAGQTLADGAVNEHRGDSRIDPAREAAHDLPTADLGGDSLRRFFDERGDRPVARAAADAVRQVAETGQALIGVRNLRMKQQRVEITIERIHRAYR